MKQSLMVIAVLIGVILLSFNCTDLKKDLSPFTSGNGSIHNQDWGISASAGFHGKYLKANDWNVSGCASCHGAEFTGGSSGVSCRDCHASFPHSHDFEESNGHPAYMKANGFPLSACKLCHGSSYAGGSVVTEGCTECHSNPGGPEACNTCHGNFDAAGNDTISWAPPRALNGSTLESYAGVGAHRAHLADTTISKVIKCIQCHHVPSSFSASGHLNGTVDVVFDTSLAALKTTYGTPTPIYNSTGLTCSNVYCHGYFKNGNSANAPTWNRLDSTQAACGTCHGNASTGNPLPAGTHLQGVGINNCQNCHTTGSPAVAVARYSGGVWTIIDKQKHINGKLSRFGNEAPF